MPTEYDYSESEVYYVRIYTAFKRESLGEIQRSTFLLSPAGKRLYGQWAFLPERYPQVRLDAFGLVPNFIHGILVVDVKRQRGFVRPRGIALASWRSMRYSFVEIVRGFQNATSAIRPASLQRGFSFYVIGDDPTLSGTRMLISQSPSKWDSSRKRVDETDWPKLTHVKPIVADVLVRESYSRHG